ncbi:MAG: preprotein translocase subunit YajC [Chloroflexi bacterium]|nr:preprotein translocase subunit YajC [Chloroflexota bacterium]
MDQTNFAVIILLTSMAFVFILVWVVVVLPQNRARKNQQQVVAELKVGDEVVTVGGLVGKLTYLNHEEDIARIEIAKGIEVRIIPAAISHPLDYMERVEKAKREKTMARRKR